MALSGACRRNAAGIAVVGGHRQSGSNESADVRTSRAFCPLG